MLNQVSRKCHYWRMVSGLELQGHPNQTSWGHWHSAIDLLASQSTAGWKIARCRLIPINKSAHLDELFLSHAVPLSPTNLQPTFAKNCYGAGRAEYSRDQSDQALSFELQKCHNPHVWRICANGPVQSSPDDSSPSLS